MSTFVFCKCISDGLRRKWAALLGLALVLASVLSAVAPARADTVEQDVLNDPGMVYNTFAWQITPDLSSLSTGTFSITGQALQPSFFTPSDGFNNTFTYPTTVTEPSPAGVQNVTDVIDPTGNDNPGVIAINFNASSVASDFLFVGIDLGYNFLQPQDMQPLFASVKELGFGEVDPSEYWFAFAGYHPGSVIGGLIETDGDIKIFGVVPTPNSGVGGMALMALVGVALGVRRFRQSVGARI